MSIPEQASGRPSRGRTFRRLGSALEARAPTHARYYVTGPDARLGPNSGHLLATGDRVHAKQVGTLLTACGLSTTSWPKLWDVAFPGVASRACPACAEIVSWNASLRSS